MDAPATQRPDRAAQRRVLMLARHFPPIGGAGVQRTLGSVRYLPQFGYDPVVVTALGTSVDRWSPEDRTLLARIPAETRVHRLGAEEPPASSAWRGRVERVLQRPAAWVKAWIDGAVTEGVRQGADAGVDVVLASCVPYETAQVGARVAAALGCPWVADLEDPWALDEMRVQPTLLHQARDLRRMRSCLSSAAAVIMCAPEAATRVRAAMPEIADRVSSIPIGFEPEDFCGPIVTHDEVFRIVHAGSLHSELGARHRRSHRRRAVLRGTSLDVDILTRSHVFIIEAIDRLIAAEPSLAEKVELVLVGGHTAADAAAADRPYVRMLHHLPHDEVVAIMRGADLLFLPMHDLPPGRRAGIIPYKTYEYLAAQRPILAAVPDGDVRDLLSGIDRASVVRPADVDAMSSAIRARMTAPRHDSGNDERRLRRDEMLTALQRRLQVQRIAAVLDDVLERDQERGAPRRSVTRRRCRSRRSPTTAESP